MINALDLQVFMVLTHTWLNNFCGGILVSSQGFGVFWEILMLYSRLMISKGGDFNINDLTCMSFTGLCYTWCNGRSGLHGIHRKLHRVLCNGVCLDE